MALITAGWTYKFVFIKKFTDYNGVYTISKVYSWAEVLNEQLSLYDLLYAPLNIPETEYNEDVIKYKNENIYKLMSPEDGTILYAPESIIAQVPIYPVNEYQKLVMFLPLGVYDSEEGLDYLVQEIGSEINGVLGLDITPKLTTVGNVYLTEKEYNEAQALRKSRVDRILNWFSAYTRIKEENNILKAQLEGYQKLLNSKVGG